MRSSHFRRAPQRHRRLCGLGDRSRIEAESDNTPPGVETEIAFKPNGLASYETGLAGSSFAITGGPDASPTPGWESTSPIPN